MCKFRVHQGLKQSHASVHQLIAIQVKGIFLIGISLYMMHIGSQLAKYARILNRGKKNEIRCSCTLGSSSVHSMAIGVLQQYYVDPFFTLFLLQIYPTQCCMLNRSTYREN